MSRTLHIHLLGDFRLEYDDAPVTTINTPRLQSLLAYLVLHRDAPQSRQHLAFLLWTDSTEAQARTNLRNLLHHLRRSLPDADRFLQAEGRTLQWRTDAPFTLDVADFENTLIQASSPAAAREALEKAVALYQGDLLPSCYDDWILPERERLGQEFVRALERLILLQESQRDYGAAIRHAQRLLRHDQLHEATYRHLMRLRALNGDRAAALRVYHTCVTVLERELAVEPSPATREAYERLVTTEALPRPPQTGLVAISPLVGRDQEWAQLQAAWQASAKGPHFVLLAGEVGIGKTRLAEELVAWAARQGITTASARCYAAEEDLAYAPLTTWLRAHPLPPLDNLWLTEVARLLPELLVERPDLSRPAALTEAWQRQRLFEALTRAVLGWRQPLLLLIDDLQWCDRETLEWLHYLLRLDPQARLLIVGTLRMEDTAADDPLASLLAALRRGEQLTEIELKRLDEAETASLAANVADRELEPALVSHLYGETEGNPLFVIETVRAGLPTEGQGTTRVSYAPVSGTLRLPPKVQAVIEARLTQLSPPARAIAELAAVIGRAVTFDVLAQASDGDEDTLVHGLDELWQRRILREQGTDAYDFSHDKIREVAYANLSAARRRQLHRRAAQALETVFAADLDAVSGQVAAHYERAKRLEQAIPYYRRAATVARKIYANEEAIAYFQQALALCKVIPPGALQRDGGGEMAAELCEGLGDVLELTGRHDEARAAYQDALAQIPGSPMITRSRIQRKVGNTWKSQGRYEEALQTFRAAQATLGWRPVESTAEWRREWLEIQFDRMWAHYALGHWLVIKQIAEETRRVVEKHGTPAHRARFFQTLTAMALRRDRYVVSEETLAYHRAGLAASLEAGDLSEIAWNRCGLGLALLCRGEFDEAEEQIQAALRTAEQTGQTDVQTTCLTYLTIIHRKRGGVKETQRYASQSLAAATAREMHSFMGAAKANLSWVAWRQGELGKAQEKGQAALEMLPTTYPFRWTALWPLIGVALAQDQVAEAIVHAHALLDPTQQRLPRALASTLQEAVEAWQAAQPEATTLHLSRAVEVAQKAGYL